MQTEERPVPRYKKFRFQLLVGLIIVLILGAVVPQLTRSPVPADQVRLNRAVDYFASNYNATVGLIPETPGSSTYWLYSDNFLAIIALSRYDPGNQSTSTFSGALEAAFSGYEATMPGSLTHNQYLALNSSAAYFACSSSHQISWTGTAGTAANASAVLMTASNDLGPSCATQNYADLLLLQALYQRRLGNTAESLDLYRNASTDFDGYGFRDLAYTSNSSSSHGVYQTYKVALFVYTTYCLGQQSSSNLAPAIRVLYYMQANSTGGFQTGYVANILSGPGLPITPNGSTNTETTALAALALELIIHPTNAC